jgi:hypothetical protein
MVRKEGRQEDKQQKNGGWVLADTVIADVEINAGLPRAGNLLESHVCDTRANAERQAQSAESIPMQQLTLG